MTVSYYVDGDSGPHWSDKHKMREEERKRERERERERERAQAIEI